MKIPPCRPVEEWEELNCEEDEAKEEEEEETYDEELDLLEEENLEEYQRTTIPFLCELCLKGFTRQ